ncbi:unnamed protein product [Spodoptera littoralis]|uniref:Uncharacterized protein n=1 Tax=Spodoptera littoralis TaxID=7109 RepID=A0A9P0ICB1_SPOLI|nr:unnamed protein product [Spodoptera littoralis]CAH1642630.1 unnamed protein product [Spodoptera littoralis]
MRITKLIVLLTVILNYNLVNCDFNTTAASKVSIAFTDTFNETILMKEHEELMNMVNAFYRDLNKMLQKNKSKKEIFRNNKGVKGTTRSILRTASFATNSNFNQSISTNSTLKPHKLPDYVSQPLFPIPEITRNILHAKPVSTPRRTTFKPSTVTLQPKQSSYESTFAIPSIPIYYKDKRHFTVALPTRSEPEQFTFRSVNSSSQSPSKTVASAPNLKEESKYFFVPWNERNGDETLATIINFQNAFKVGQITSINYTL